MKSEYQTCPLLSIPVVTNSHKRMEGSSKAQRAESKIFRDDGENTEVRKRSAIVKELTASVMSWVQPGFAVATPTIAVLQAKPVTALTPNPVWLFECQTREQSWTTSFLLQCQALMIKHTRATSSLPATPFLPVTDGFWVTETPSGLQRSIGFSFPKTFVPNARNDVCMFVASRVPADAVPLQKTLNADVAPAQVRAVVASIKLATMRYRIVMRYIAPHNLWTRPITLGHDGVAIGSAPEIKNPLSVQ